MKKFTVILIISLLLTGNAYAKVKSKDITFPGKFYTKLKVVQLYQITLNLIMQKRLKQLKM